MLLQVIASLLLSQIFKKSTELGTHTHTHTHTHTRARISSFFPVSSKSAWLVGGGQRPRPNLGSAGALPLCTGFYGDGGRAQPGLSQSPLLKSTASPGMALHIDGEGSCPLGMI